MLPSPATCASIVGTPQARCGRPPGSCGERAACPARLWPCISPPGPPAPPPALPRPLVRTPARRVSLASTSASHGIVSRTARHAQLSPCTPHPPLCLHRPPRRSYVILKGTSLTYFRSERDVQFPPRGRIKLGPGTCVELEGLKRRRHWTWHIVDKEVRRRWGGMRWGAPSSDCKEINWCPTGPLQGGCGAPRVACCGTRAAANLFRVTTRAAPGG